MTELSKDQKDAYETINAFADAGTETCLSLIGAAGTGKTTLMKAVVEDLTAKGHNVFLSAPTHKASNQLELSTGYPSRTTHSLFSLKLTRNYKTGVQSLKVDGEPKFVDGAFLVIDEASMLGEKLLKHVIDGSKNKRVKILFIGDLEQLSPVNEEPSLTVDPVACPWPLIELTTIHRQAAGNPIIALATAIRQDGSNLPTPEHFINLDGTGTAVLQYQDWSDQMLESCATDSDSRYLAYTNQAVDAASRAIRCEKYGDGASQPYLPGELVIANDQCVARNAVTGKSVTVPNNTELTVLSAEAGEDQQYLLRVNSPVGELMIGAYANYQIRARRLQLLANQAKKAARQGNKLAWKEFWWSHETFADLRAAHALTVHKSQGSTFKNVFVNWSQFGMHYISPQDRKRLLYVATTRASHAVYITHGD